MYYARALNKSETNLDMGPFGRMGVFRRENGNDELLGSYIRNYGTAFNTFFPFHLNGKDLALYSPDYTATRIMELPSCQDIGGEEPNALGFCPVEYFVPTYLDQENVHRTNNKSFPAERVSVKRINNPSDDNLREFSEEYTYVNGVTGQECKDVDLFRPLTPILYYPFGFIAGCIWGDENTWKVQYLDLSKAHEGILVREERFGYIELPEDLRLKDAIDMTDYLYDTGQDDSFHIRIKVVQSFDLKSGRAVNPFY